MPVKTSTYPLHSQTLKFLSLLKKNNHKDFMDAHREQWAEIRSGLCHFVDALILDLSRYDAAVANESSKSSVFRINRDIRFSKDKSPYKENIGAFVCAGGKKNGGAGYYLHIQPGGNTFLAGGIYAPDAPALFRIRQEIDYNGAAFKKLLKAKSFCKYFNGLDEAFSVTRFPKGFDEKSAHASFIPYSSYIVSTGVFTDKTVVSPLFYTQTLDVFKSMVSFNTFLNTALHDPA